MVENNERDLIVAHHEAGHVVAAVERRLPITHVTIVESEDAAGVTGFHAPSEASLEEIDLNHDTWRVRQFVESHIMASFAGSIAEARFRPVRREDSHEWDHDYSVAATLALKVCGSSVETDAYLEWLYARTVGMMDQPYRIAMVAGVVDALIEHRTLSGRAGRKAARAGRDRWVAEGVAARSVLRKMGTLPLTAP